MNMGPSSFRLKTSAMEVGKMHQHQWTGLSGKATNMVHAQMPMLLMAYCCMHESQSMSSADKSEVSMSVIFACTGTGSAQLGKGAEPSDRTVAWQAHKGLSLIQSDTNEAQNALSSNEPETA